MSDLSPEHVQLQVEEITTQAGLNIAFDIRHKVFVDEQKVDPAEEYDEYEASSRHFLVRMNGHACATGRFRSTDFGWKIERMAVLAAYRGHGCGAAVLQNLLANIPNDGRPVYLHAQEHALAFYEKNNFKAVGERFWEANIPHFKCIWAPPQRNN